MRCRLQGLDLKPEIWGLGCELRFQDVRGKTEVLNFKVGSRIWAEVHFLAVHGAGSRYTHIK